MNFLRKILYNQYWNIGFCNQTPEELIYKRILKPIQWVKHPYRDRWFADPFILSVSEKEIVVFVEECSIKTPKGIICELHIDRQSMRLKERYVLLERDTHLSYPAIIVEDGIVYIYPENGQSGELNMYEYDSVNHKLINPTRILNEAVADSTILHYGEEYYICATKYPDTQKGVYLYKSKSLKGPYVQCEQEPFNVGLDSSRPAGNWFVEGKTLYRPAQDCVARYGSALSLMEVSITGISIEEKKKLSIQPVSWRYNLGIHTLNFKDGFCVVDSFGYLYPVIARIILFCIKVKHKLGL